MRMHFDHVVERLRNTVLAQDEARLTDGQLLTRIVETGDQSAIATIVRRHGAMVWGVCRRVLSNHHDAEDAFQASFLVLVRKAASVRKREAVANWLYGVAYHTALKLRTKLARWRTREKQGVTIPEPQITEQHDWCDLHVVLDQELSRLPEKYRTAIVLCDLEGRTYKEAAGQVQCLVGTLTARLVRGRKLLARRLTRRGVALSATALAVILTQKSACATLPVAVLSTTLKIVSLFPAGIETPIGVVSTKVTALADGVMRAMFVSKLMKVTAALLIGVSLITFGAAFAYHNRSAVQDQAADRASASSSQNGNDKEHQVAFNDDSKASRVARPLEREADDKTAGPGAPRRVGPLHLQFNDDSIVNIRAGDQRLTFVTEFGKLQIPLAEVQKLELGRRVSDEVARQIATAIGKLDSESFDEREQASADLLSFGAKAYMDLQTAAENGNMEVKHRALEILERIKARLGPDAPQLRRYDIIWTGGSKIVGKVQDDVLQVGSLFGDIKVNLADVRSLGKELSEPSPAKREDTCANCRNLMACSGQFGTRHSLTVTGQVNGPVWGSQVYTLDSSVATAAVHAGVLRIGQIGTVVVEVLESPPSFAGSTNNGVTTTNWLTYPQGAFRFVTAWSAPTFAPRQGHVAIQFVDGSVIEVTARDDTLKILTDKGAVAVRVADIYSIDLATRVPEADRVRIAAAIKKLGSDSVKDRDLASAELIGQGARAYPALLAAATDSDSETATQAQCIIARLKEILPAGMLEVRDVDTIITKDKRVTGKIESSTLRVTSPYVGELELRLSDIHSLRSSSLVESAK